MRRDGSYLTGPPCDRANLSHLLGIERHNTIRIAHFLLFSVMAAVLISGIGDTGGTG